MSQSTLLKNGWSFISLIDSFPSLSSLSHIRRFIRSFAPKYGIDLETISSLTFRDRNFNRKTETISPIHHLAIGINWPIGAKGREANQTLVHDDAQAPPVAAGGVATLVVGGEDLRGDVVRRPHRRVGQLSTISLKIKFSTIFWRQMIYERWKTVTEDP